MVNSRNTARVAQPLPGDALYQRRARIVLPILVRIANANETIEYGELAKVAGMPNPRNLNYVLSCIGQTLIALSRSWDTEIPPIQCLVVSKGSGAPSEGIVEFFSGQRDYARLTRDQQREIMGVEQKRAFTFRKWPDVLADLGLGDGSQRFSAEDYMAALREAPLGQQHRRMLAVHHAAPDRTVTAAQLARAVGYSSYEAANLHYGRLGGLICRKLHWSPSPSESVAAIVRFEKRRGEWHWIMRPEVAQALELLGWTDTDTASSPTDFPGEQHYFEGSRRSMKVDRHERSRTARDQCVRHHGWACAACGLLLEEVYGDAARNLIHVHHLNPLSESDGRRSVDPVRDLRPVCPTCHAVIHRATPAYTIEQVREMLAAVRRRGS